MIALPFSSSPRVAAFRLSCVVVGQARASLQRRAFSTTRVDRLSALSDQQLPDPEVHGRALHLLALHRHKTRRLAHRRFADRLGIRSIVRLAFVERLGVGWRDQSHFVAQLTHLTTPEMSPSACLHRNDGSRKLAEKFQNLRPPQLLA